MTVWSKIENGEIYVVAIYDFEPTSPHHLALEVGERVLIEGETRDWYWGSSVRRCAKGAFPKNYVTKQLSRGDKSSKAVVSSVSADVVECITRTLHEWLAHLKKLYLVNDSRFATMQTNMCILMQLRTQIASETMPQEELKRFSTTARFTIDSGNRTLGLDLVIRDECGLQVQPMMISVSELNKLHENADSMFALYSDRSSTTKPIKTPITRTVTIVGKVTNFMCRLFDNLRLSLAIFNGNGEQLTESVLLQWAPPHHAAAELYSRPAFVFTDLSTVIVEKSFLVCHVVRLGSMEAQSSDRYRRTMSHLPDRVVNIQRPCGIACAEIRLAVGQDMKEIQLPFFMCEKETMDTLMKNLISNRELRDRKLPFGLWMNIQLVEGGIKQIYQEYPHLRDSKAVARKMGFPEVIYPDDVRNDLYVTLVGGTFARDGKPSDRNIELVARVIDKQGRQIPNVIWRDAGAPPIAEYTSTVYYHDDRPRWQEVFKVGINIEEFKEAHIVFLLRHRSSDDAKDRNKRFFALSYLRLMQPEGTTTPDTKHNLAVYKIEYKRGANVSVVEKEASLACLNLGSFRHDPFTNRCNSSGLLSLLQRDMLTVATKLCSTKLTYREEILGILNWRALHDQSNLRYGLKLLLNVPSDELVKFLQDILDALFLILSQFGEGKDFTDQSYAVLVFDCLLLVLSLVTEQKYQHFKPVLQAYIDDSFCHALAYEQLLPVIVWTIRTFDSNESACKRLQQCLKSLENLMRLIVRSRHLRQELVPLHRKTDYCPLLLSFLEALVWLMGLGEQALACQGAAIKYLPHAIPHLVKICPKNLLSHHTVSALEHLSLDKLPVYRLKALIELFRGPLGVSPAPRGKIISHLANIVCNFLRPSSRHEPELELCVEAVGEVMSLLSRQDVGPVGEDIGYITKSILRPVLRIASNMKKDHNKDKLQNTKLLRKIICTLLDLCKNMNEVHYTRNTILPLENAEDSKDIESVSIACELMMAILEKPVFPQHWADMLYTQHYSILHALSLVSVRLCRKLKATQYESNSEIVVVIQSLLVRWFCTVGAVTTSAPLQLESVLEARRKRALDLFGDIRIRAAAVMAETWKNLGVYKRLFIPQLIGPFLQVSFVHNEDVRKTVIPLFFDMMQTLYDITSVSGKPNIKLIEEKLIDEVEVLVKAGWGDAEWSKILIQICGGMCKSSDSGMLEAGGSLVAAVASQLIALLQYHGAPPRQREHLILNVLSFYERINRPDLYLRYVHRLADLHREKENWSEAALALQLHAKLLEWNDLPLPQGLRHPARALAENHMELKIRLHEEAAHLLERDRQWMLAAHLLQDLVSVRQRCAHRVLLAELHEQLAQLYRQSLRQPLIPPTYFRVRYVGRGFADYLLEPLGFVYRANPCEMLQSFKERMLEKWPGAEVLLKLGEPGQEVTESDGQYLQINSVKPLMADKWRYLLDCRADDEVIRYFEHNDVNTFEFSRPFHRSDDSLSDTMDAKTPNEFATMWLERTEIRIADMLPGILRCFPVVSSKTYDLSPLEGAVEAIENSNRELKRAIMEVQCKGDSLLILTLKLQGILDASVQGGLENYERTFFTEKYVQNRPEHGPLLQRLRDRISDQVELLAKGLRIHADYSTETELHDHLVNRFNTVYKQYGADYTENELPELDQISIVELRTNKRLGDYETRSNGSRISDISSGNESSGLKLPKCKKKSLIYKWSSQSSLLPVNSPKKRNKDEVGKRGRRLHYSTIDSNPPNTLRGFFSNTLSRSTLIPKDFAPKPEEKIQIAEVQCGKNHPPHHALVPEPGCACTDSDIDDAPPQLPPKPSFSSNPQSSVPQRPKTEISRQLRMQSMPPEKAAPPVPPKNHLIYKNLL